MFFKSLSEKIGDYTINLTIKQEGNQLIVMFLPKLNTKKDDAQNEIVPLTIKGTPEQLDAGFIPAISQGLLLTTGLQTNIKEFEAGIKKAEKKVKGKDVEKKDTTDSIDDDKSGASATSQISSDENVTDENEDQIPFGDNKVNTGTGEIKETIEVTEKKETAKAIEPKTKKSVEPKAKKEPEAKAEKVDPAATGEIIKSEDDEW